MINLWAYFVEPGADVRSDDKLDAFNVELDEGDPEVLVVGEGGVASEELDGI